MLYSTLHPRTGRLALALSLSVACTAAVACSTPTEEVPSIYDDPALLTQIQEADGVGPIIPRHRGFAFGEPSYYWGFGMQEVTTMSAYVLCRRSGSRCRPIDHPPIVAAVPGEDAYRNYAHIFHVPIRGSFDESQRIASEEELEEAISAGLVDEPERTQTYMHCPIVGPDVRLEVGPDQLVAPTPIYAHGAEALCFDFTPEEPMPLSPDLEMLVRNVYILSRESQDYPLSEGLSGMDLNGDGDYQDGNNILGTVHGRADYTPLWRMVMVTVPDSYGSIDTYEDGTTVDYDDSHDMFDIAPDYTITPLPDRIVSHELTDMMVDCPIQAQPGGL